MQNGKKLKVRISPTAWAKMLYLQEISKTEVGGFGISIADDLLYIDDFELIKQRCTPVSVKFDDEDVSNFLLDKVEEGFLPEQVMRIWVHTHPGMNTTPSPTDEKVFSRAFGSCDWAVMLILSNSSKPYCRIKFNSGVLAGTYMEIDVEVDYLSRDFYGTDFAEWEKEFQEKVIEEQMMVIGNVKNKKTKHNNKSLPITKSNEIFFDSIDDWMIEEDYGYEFYFSSKGFLKDE